MRSKPRMYTSVSFYFSDFPQQELAHYAGAFLAAARTLMRSLRRRRGFSNVAVAPVLFTYRHAIELYLKSLIVLGTRSIAATDAENARVFKSLTSHKLLPLLSRVEQVFKEGECEWYWPKRSIRTFADVSRLLAYVEDLDPDSFAFRYPVNTKGSRAVRTDVEIPFEIVVDALDDLAEALDTTEFGLSAELSR
jgi:hypothetical protein